jgi:hypothetical protein
MLLMGVTASVLMASTAQASAIFYTSQAAFDAASTTSLLEDFSGAPTKDTPLASLSLNGVTYTGFAGVPFANVWVASPGYTAFGADVGTTTENILTANGDEDIVAAFSTPYTAVGFNAFYNGLGDGTLTVYGAANAVLGSLTFTGGFNPATGLADRGYLGVTSNSDIYGFRFTTNVGAQLDTGFTNISVGSANRGVPEPATWALMLTGFGLAGAALRRRRTALAA